jgi:hypothetical protein
MGRCAGPRSQRRNLDRRCAATSGAHGIRRGAATRRTSRHTRSDPESNAAGNSDRRESPRHRGHADRDAVRRRPADGGGSDAAGSRARTGCRDVARTEACARRSKERIESGARTRDDGPDRRRQSRDCDRGVEAITGTRTNAFRVGGNSGVFAGGSATTSGG